jgi:hypothetical protein
MGNILDELLTEKEKEELNEDTLREQDHAIMMLSSDKKCCQNLIDGLSDFLNNPRVRVSKKDKKYLSVFKEKLKSDIINIDKTINLI